MTSEKRRLSGSSYTFYSFPPTPSQSSGPPTPAAAKRRPPKLQRAPKTPIRTLSSTSVVPPETTSRSFPPSVSSSSDMAPKSAPKLPSTPTRSGRNPTSSQTPKLGSSAQSAKNAGQGGAQKLGAKAGDAKDAASPKLPPRPSQSDEALTPKARSNDPSDKTQRAREQSEDTADDARQKITLKDNDPQNTGDADDEETDTPHPGRSGQNAEESTDSFQEIDPRPESDDEDVEGASETGKGEDVNEGASEDAGEAEGKEDGQGGSGGIGGALGGLTGGAKGLAGKTTGAVGKTAQGAKDTTGGAAKNVGNTASGLKDTVQGTAGKASKGDVKGATGEVTDGAKGAGRGTLDTAKDAAGGVKDTTQGATDDVTDGVKDAAPKQVGDTVKGAKDTADGAVDQVGDKAEDAVDQAEDTADGAVDTAKDTAEGATDKVQDTAEGVTDKVKDTAEDAADQLPVDFSILKGLSLGRDGNVFDDDGNHVGQLEEGQASDLAGYEIGDDGEILDDDGDLVGRVGLTDEAKELAQQRAHDATDKAEEAGDKIDEAGDQAQDAADNVEDAADQAADDAGEAADEAKETYMPDVSILKGLTVQENGDIYDKQGKLVGRVTEGDPSYLVDQELNEEGEVLDEDGDAIGRAEVVPQEVDEAEEDVEGAADNAKQDIKDTAEETADQAQQDLPTEIVPDLSILQSRKINKKGRILDDEGEPIGQLTDDSDLRQCIGKIPNEKGEIVNDDGEVVGKVEVVEGEPAQELMKELHPELVEQIEQAKQQASEEVPDLSALEGYKVNKKGEVMNEDGEPLAKLSEGDAAECAGKKINDQGEVLDKEGNVIGKVELVDAAADEEPEQIEDETPDLSELEGLKVNKKGQVLNEDGEPIAEVAEGEISDLAGKKINDQGQVLDKDGNVIGTVQYLKPENEAAEGEDPEAKEGEDKDGEGEGEGKEEQHEDSGYEDGTSLPDISTLEGLTCNKQGYIVDSSGNQVGRLVEGEARKIWKAGHKLDDQGQFWNDRGKVIGRAEVLPREEEDEEAPFAGLEGLLVVKGGFVEDENGNRVGKLVEGDEKKLVGRAVDEDGDILDKKGNAIGRAERYEEDEPQPEPEAEKPDLSVLKGLAVNKQGNVIGPDGVPIARLVEGSAKELAGRKCDEEGQIWNDSGKVVGRCELIPDNERESKAEGPFAGLEGLHVVKGGMVEDEDGNTVGQVVEGDAKKLIGRAVDEDGDIIDRYGNVKGRAEPYEEEEEQEPEADDLSSLEGKVVNKAGNVVDEHGTVFGRIVSGDPKKMAGRKVDGQGQIWSDNGKVIGHAELVPGDQQNSKPEGPFSAFSDLTVDGEGMVLSGGEIVGRLVEGDAKKLKGRHVDEDGDVLDRNGNSLGKAERWEPEKKEHRSSPMAGRKVNKQGEVVDENGDVIGRLTAGDLGRCIGCEINDSGDVMDNDQNKIGECTLLENIQEEEVEEEEEPEMSEEERKAHEDAELAKKMNGIVHQTIDRMEPICKEITEHIERADRTPKDELDEDDLVNKVKPLLEEGGRVLQECNGSLRSLDPDGSIAARAKANAAGREATPEEYQLAESLKELTTNIVKTVDNAKKRIADMPHAKKKLNPLWSLLTEPLFQIIAAVGLLLAGVLGLVGRLLNGLGLGGLVNGLLGGLGIDKLLGGLGLGSITEALGMGGKGKKK